MCAKSMKTTYVNGNSYVMEVIPKQVITSYVLSLLSKATLKKKFVSCTAGGRNYGQSGGCKLKKIRVFLCVFFFLGGGGKKLVKIILQKKVFVENEKKSSQSALMDSPGRWTGNNIFSKGGLIRNITFLHLHMSSLLDKLSFDTGLKLF